MGNFIWRPGSRPVPTKCLDESQSNLSERWNSSPEDEGNRRTLSQKTTHVQTAQAPLQQTTHVQTVQSPLQQTVHEQLEQAAGTLLPLEGPTQRTLSNKRTGDGDPRHPPPPPVAWPPQEPTREASAAHSLAAVGQRETSEAQQDEVWLAERFSHPSSPRVDNAMSRGEGTFTTSEVANLSPG